MCTPGRENQSLLAKWIRSEGEYDLVTPPSDASACYMPRRSCGAEKLSLGAGHTRGWPAWGGNRCNAMAPREGGRGCLGVKGSEVSQKKTKKKSTEESEV
jgi:hypothetical protein